MKSLIAAILLCVCVSSISLARSATDLTFMEGRWQGEQNGNIIVSHYIAGNWQVFVGRTYIKDSTGKTTFVELIRAEMIQGQLILTPYPMGNKGASFTAGDITKNSATFENPKNAFPSKISYAVSADGVLTTRAEGVKDGKPTVYEYQQKRINSTEL